MTHYIVHRHVIHNSIQSSWDMMCRVHRKINFRKHRSQGMLQTRVLRISCLILTWLVTPPVHDALFIAPGTGVTHDCCTIVHQITITALTTESRVSLLQSSDPHQVHFFHWDSSHLGCRMTSHLTYCKRGCRRTSKVFTRLIHSDVQKLRTKQL